MVRGPNNGSIYIARETLIDQCLQEEDSPVKGFLWVILYFIKRGLVILGLHSREKYFKKIVSLFFISRKYLVRGPNNGSIYIAKETLIHQCLQEEDSPGKGFLWGILYFIKRGLVILGLHSKEKYLKKIVSLFSITRKYLVRGPKNGSIYIYI